MPTVERPHHAGLGEIVTLIAAATQTNEDVGGLLMLALGVGIYACMAFKDWLSDVRYYRAREIVRSRELGQ
jgi:hypothetical protein